MKHLQWEQSLFGIWTVCLLLALTGNAYGAIVYDATSDVILSGQGNSSSYYEWTLGYDNITVNANLTVADTSQDYNRLTIDTGQKLYVKDTLKLGSGNISNYSNYNRIDVHGTLDVGNLDLSNGWSALKNTLSILDGGLVTADSLSLYYHWSYGNNWLELNGGMLVLTGNCEANFAEDQGILSSIKIWDKATESYQRIGTYSGTSLSVDEDYYAMLLVEYIDDTTEAEALGISTDFVGSTVITNISAVPVPGSLSLLGIGLAALLVAVRNKRG